MKVMFTIRVGIEAPSYVQIGEKLDKITKNLEDTVGRRNFDLETFTARHQPVDMAKAYPMEENMGAQAMVSNYREPEPDRDFPR